MKSYLAKKQDVQHGWKLVDASGQRLGRLAAKVAPMLMGKDKPTYTPHVDTGDYVVIINADKIEVSGNKADTKEYDHYTRYPGGRKVISFRRMKEERPERVVELAVKRMMPKNTLGAQMFKKLKVYSGSEHEHQAQQPEKIDI